MKFLLFSDSWQEKTTRYYRSSLDSENEGNFITEFSENSLRRGNGQEEMQDAQKENLKEILQEEPVQKIEQTKLSAFFGF